MLTKIYEKILEREIKKVPRHVVVVCKQLGESFLKFAEWCGKFGISEVTVCSYDKVRESLLRGYRVRIIGNGIVRELSGREPVINIINHTGHEEILTVIRKLAQMIAENRLNPEDVDERTFEKFLTVKTQPDIIIKAGNEVPEFLIWQGIYSELYFADIDWDNLRYIDFLRILREYQRRERRYGR
ncbi:undecaprenyl diphosphate synthase family protein [Archaeoglobus neptunius]|uniref:undecaprenyl diphosphate synthase family protein n=1 Tax=Archaeoglobus neptunius TaxID=2798580 RepID=UPI001928B82E|nr:undecaprenyl diphosphate synthase family protein [Archaeoglobus neptunius]